MQIGVAVGSIPTCQRVLMDNSSLKEVAKNLLDVFNTIKADVVEGFIKD